MSESSRRPGDRIIRRRLQSTQVITIPEPVPIGSGPNTLFHARLFIAAFAAIILLGTAILALPWVTNADESTSLPDALFIATSAASVTGLVTVDTLDHWNWAGQLVILVLIQSGGLGFMVGASLVLRVIGRGGGQRVRDAIMIQDNIPTLTLREAVDVSRRIVKFTIVAETAGAVLLAGYFAREMPLLTAIWHGIFHSVSAFCNAGFDLQGGFQSMTPYRESIWVNAIFMTLVLAGGLSYIVLADISYKRRWSTLSVNSKIILVSSLLLTLIGAVTFLAAEWNESMASSAVWSRPLQALFQSISGRTAGFQTVDFSDVNSFTLFIYLALMFVGGASGSTAGGVKLATVAVVAVTVMSTLRGQEEPEVFKRRIPVLLVHRAMAVIVLFFLLHFLVTFSLAVTETFYGENPAFLRILFESMSAVVTNGLGNGITPILSTPGKIIICIAMFLGRIGPLTLVYALQRRQSYQPYRYPETSVHIG
ncbi:TrkH family potassium uptake protein [soil metagenome]